MNPFTRPPHMLKPHFKAAIKDGGVLEMVIYEEIGENPWTGEGVTAKTIKQQMDSGKYDRIRVRINSPGGSAFEGMAIYNLLRSAGKPIETFNDACAASAASVIFMAGDERTMAANAITMIHNASGGCIGTSKDMLKTASILDTVTEAIASTFVAKTGKTLKEIQSMMDEESWMRAEESVRNGFATAIGQDNKKAMAMARNFKGFNNMKNLSEALKASTEDDCQCSCSSCQMGNCLDCTNDECDDAACEDCPMQNPVGASTRRPVRSKRLSAAAESEIRERQLRTMRQSTRRESPLTLEAAAAQLAAMRASIARSNSRSEAREAQLDRIHAAQREIDVTAARIQLANIGFPVRRR